MITNSIAFLVGLVTLAIFIALLRRCGPKSRLYISIIALIVIALNSILPMILSVFLIIPILVLAFYLANRVLRKRKQRWERWLLVCGLGVVLIISLSVGLDLATNLASHLKWNIYGSSSYNVTQEIDVFGPAAGKRRLSIENGLMVDSKRLDCNDYCKTFDMMDELDRKNGNFGLSDSDPVQESFEATQSCVMFRPISWVFLFFCNVEYDPYYGYVREMQSVDMNGSDGGFSSTLSDLQLSK